MMDEENPLYLLFLAHKEVEALSESPAARAFFLAETDPRQVLNRARAVVHEVGLLGPIARALDIYMAEMEKEPSKFGPDAVMLPFTILGLTTGECWHGD